MGTVMPKFVRLNSHFIKFTDEIYKFEENNSRETNLENVINNLETLRSKENSKTEEILRLEQVIQKLNEKVAEEKIKRKGAERDLKKFHENSTELKNELENIKRQNSYLAKKLREI